MFFQNREEAGRALAARLGAYRNSGTVVLGLPRGGVPVAREIATALGAPLDLVLVRKIGAPSQPELAIGAVSDGEQPDLVLNERIVGILDVEPGYLEREKTRALAEIDRRRRLYLGGRTPVALEGRTAILVDDGLATGMTALAALRGVRRRHPRRIVLAVPVASPEIVETLRPEADEIVCLRVSDELMSVGEAYLDFRQLTDEEVVALLRAGEGPAPERP
jgi:putative phosphoribosyl transferase